MKRPNQGSPEESDSPVDWVEFRKLIKRVDNLCRSVEELKARVDIIEARLEGIDNDISRLFKAAQRAETSIKIGWPA